MPWVVDFLAGGGIVADRGNFDAGGASALAAAGHAVGELGFEGDDLALVRTAVGRARRLRVGDILGDEIELLRPVMAIFSDLKLEPIS